MLGERNLTRHAYDEALATQIYQHIVQDHTPPARRHGGQDQTLRWD